MLRIAILGLGPWGLSALGQLVCAAQKPEPLVQGAEVHVVEPGCPGVGIYDPQEPDYLLMNNACGEIAPFGQGTEGGAGFAIGLHEWVEAEGYREEDGCYRKSVRGRRVSPDDFLPRRLMGEYLAHLYAMVVGAAPDRIRIVRHATRALHIRGRIDGREEVCLEDGRSLAVDHVLITLGQVADATDHPKLAGNRFIHPYPIREKMAMIPPDCHVGVAGMGLVSVDVIAALTIGRGGRFVERGGRLTYRQSGREPKIYLMSRSGLPYLSKPRRKPRVAGREEPLILTRSTLERLLARGTLRVDFNKDVLPLIFREMAAHYYVQSAYLAEGSEASRVTSMRLGAAHVENRFQDEIDVMSERFGVFDAEQLFVGTATDHESSETYNRFVCDLLESDVREEDGVRAFARPAKAAASAFRIIRDPCRTLLESRALSLESYLNFHRNVSTRINRLASGPPARRVQELATLFEAGVVTAPYGPEPAFRPDEANSTAVHVRSTNFSRPYERTVDLVVRGHIGSARMDTTPDPLLSNLYQSGRLVPMRYGDLEVGSMELTPDSHPLDRSGRVQDRVWILGPLTEGARYFTHYIPSPHRGTRGYQEIAGCLERILS